MLRASLHRIPGRFVVGANPSLYSKGGTTIDAELQYELEPVEVAGMSKIDNRDKEANYTISITPDGRMTTAIAALLWPYGNFTPGQGIFSDTDVAGIIHGNDASKDTYTSVALETMPQMIFHPVKTLVGQATFRALRGQGTSWSGANSLLTNADTGGTFTDATFTNAGVITQDYQVTWGGVSGWSSLDFYDGLTFEPKVDYIDDNVAVHGLFNKRIKSVGGMLRGIPIGITRQQIQTQLAIQGTGAVRGASGAAKAFSVTVTGADGLVYLKFSLGQLVKSKLQNGVEQLREGEVAWEVLPSITAGVRGAYFTNPIA